MIPIMKRREILQVNPASLRLAGSRRDGADPVKLQRQVAKYGMNVKKPELSCSPHWPMTSSVPDWRFQHGAQRPLAGWMRVPFGN